jgi:hypothetical protein
VDLSGRAVEPMTAHGMAWPFERIRPVLEQADVLFGNMESVVLPPAYSDDQIDPAGLVAKFDGTEALRLAGFDFMNLAANRVLDGGTVGMWHTQKLLEARGIATGGVGRTQAQARRMRVIERGGLRIGFLCYCEDTNYSLTQKGPGHAYYQLKTVLSDVKRNRPTVDVLVVSIHADLEFLPTPCPQRRENFRKIAQAGATLVLGHHPHVPQGCERLGDSLVAYSLGNCYFAAHSMPYMNENLPHTGHSFVLLAEVSRRGVESFRREPFEILPPPEERPRPCEGDARAAAMAYLDELDRMAQDDALVGRLWRERSLGMLETYLNRFKQASLDDLLENYLGRLTLVAENASWLAEIRRVVQEKWDSQAAGDYSLHRPHYELMKRRAAAAGTGR